MRIATHLAVLVVFVLTCSIAAAATCPATQSAMNVWTYDAGFNGDSVGDVTFAVPKITDAAYAISFPIEGDTPSVYAFKYATSNHSWNGFDLMSDYTLFNGRATTVAPTVSTSYNWVQFFHSYDSTPGFYQTVDNASMSRLSTDQPQTATMWGNNALVDSDAFPSIGRYAVVHNNEYAQVCLRIHYSSGTLYSSNCFHDLQYAYNELDMGWNLQVSTSSTSNGDRAAIVWQDGQNVYARVVNSSGTQVGSTITVDTVADWSTDDVSPGVDVTAFPGGFVVVYRYNGNLKLKTYSWTPALTATTTTSIAGLRVGIGGAVYGGVNYYVLTWIDYSSSTYTPRFALFKYLGTPTQVGTVQSIASSSASAGPVAVKLFTGCTNKIGVGFAWKWTDSFLNGYVTKRFMQIDP